LVLHRGDLRPRAHARSAGGGAHPGMAEIVGNLSLRPAGHWVMIGSMQHSRTAPRHVAIVAYPDVQSLDVTGPLEVFAGAAQLIRAGLSHGRGYQIAIVSSDGAPLRTSS